MSLLALLRKELAWSRRRLFLLGFLFVVLPAALSYGTLAFNTVLPTDTPLAVVPAGQNVTSADLDVAMGALTTFSQPKQFESTGTALRALSREQVYAVVRVPAGLADTDTPATVEVLVHGSIVPYLEPSKLVVSVLDYVLGTVVESEVSVDRQVVGTERTLSSYLLPTFQLVLVWLVALVYLPYNLAGEAPAVDRLRLESSLEAMVAGKLAFFGALLVLPAAVFHVFASSFGYGAGAASPGTVAVLVLTFLYLGAFASAVTIVSRFSTFGRLANVVALFALLVFSGIIYPAGFFSPLRREIVRLVPTHYSVVMTRSFVLRDASPLDYGWWFAGLLGLVALGALAVKGAVVVYERGD